MIKIFSGAIPLTTFRRYSKEEIFPMSFDNRIFRHQVQIRRGELSGKLRTVGGSYHAMTRAEDNDTPDQSPSERENVAGNEVGQRIGEIPVESVRCRSLGASHSRG